MGSSRASSSVFWSVATLVTVVAAACGPEQKSGGEFEFPPWWDATPPPPQDTDLPDTGTELPDTVDTREPVADTAPEEVVPTTLLLDGEACGGAQECASGACLPDGVWPGGYCSMRPCEEGACSDEGSACVNLNGALLCLRGCDADDACREDYWCDETIEGGRCIPGTRPVPPAPDGAACTGHDQCAGGTCLQGEAWPGGYCTVSSCVSWTDCRDTEEVPAICEYRSPVNLCLQTCERNEDCRADEGYVCAPSLSDTGICVTAYTRPPTRELDTESYPFPIHCGVDVTVGEAEIAYTIAEDTTAYAIVPFARDGALVDPLSITVPDGTTITLDGPHLFQRFAAYLLGFGAPVIFPAIPSHESLLQPGEHTFRLNTTSSDLCWYLLEEKDPGTALRLNIYLVGIDDLDAASAPSDPMMRETLDTVSSIFESAGIEVLAPRFVDVHADIVARHRIIHSEAEIETLVEQSDLLGDGLDDALSLNVFFVAGFALPGAPNLLGISTGIPGLPGVHTTSGSGVLLTAEYLDDLGGAVYTGVVLAHEAGHFLGLFHTTETSARDFDPLPDTPECRTGFPDSCEDRDNLMFPFARMGNFQLSEGQAWQIRVNPLTH